MPVTELIIPCMPFESACIDFFQLEGCHYLISVDRFSGGCDIKRAVSGTPTSGSDGLISALRQKTEDFFKRWGVCH